MSWRDVALFPVFLKEELGGPDAAQRERIRAAWERRQEKKRQAGERAYERSMNAASCGICGSAVEIWRVRKPRSLSTCATCERPVQAQHYPSFGTSGWARQRDGGPSKAMQDVLRASLVAIWHLDHPDWRPRA